MVKPSTPGRFEAVMDPFPKMKLLAAHFGSYDYWGGIEKHLLGTVSIIYSAMAPVNVIHHVKHFAYGSPYGIRFVDKLLVVPHMTVQVIQKLLGYFNAYFWHPFHRFLKIITIKKIKKRARRDLNP